MKAVVAVLLVLSPVLAFAQTGFDGYMFDGYMWEEYGKEESLANVRTSLLAGFLNGFDYGYLAGYVKGIAVSRRVMLDEFKKAAGKQKQKEGLKAVITRADSRSWPALKQGVIDDLRIRLGPKERVEEYTRDVDNFLKSYPLCRKQNIFTILDNLARVWDQTDTYEKVGEKCSEED